MIATITLHPYKFDVVFLVGETEKNIERFVNTKTIIVDKPDVISMLKWPHDKCEGRFLCSPNNEAFIMLRKYPETPRELAIMSHEIFHAVSEIMRRVGIPLSIKTEEAYAYAIDYLTNQFLQNTP